MARKYRRRNPSRTSRSDPRGRPLKRKKYKLKSRSKTNWLMWGWGIALGVVILVMLRKKTSAEPAAVPPGATPAPPTTETLPPGAVPIEGFYADESPYVRVR